MHEPKPETHAVANQAALLPDRPGLLFLAVTLAYFLGARIGLLLRFPPATTSVIWPPNALLTAFLLLTPSARWGLVVLAALPAHLLVEVPAGFPPALVAALFATNCLEALAAAAIVRRVSDDAAAFDSLRRALAFVVGAVFVAPVLSTFPDAAAVHVFQGEPFGLVCLRRVLSNSLSQLTLVPTAVLAVRYGVAWWRQTPRRRQAEALLMGLAVTVVGGLVFGGYERDSPLLLGGPYTALPLLMPLLILATVRFGPAGASLSLLASALLAIGSAISGRSPLPGLPAAERVLALQVFLIVVGVPLLVLGGVMEERRQIAATLRERLRFEAFVAGLSGAFVRLPSHRMSAEFENWLERVGTFADVDRVTLWQLTPDSSQMLPVAWWASASAGPPPTTLDRGEFQWAGKRLLLREPFVFSDPDVTPAAVAEVASLRRVGVRSLLVLPLVAADQVIGALSLVVTTRARDWPDAIVQNCRVIADVFAGALARKVAEDGLRASEAMKSAVLASLTSHVAVVDREGRIIAVNESWVRYARSNSASLGEAVGVGANYLEACRRAAQHGDEEAGEALEGIEAVLQGARTEFRQEYACPNVAGERWFHMTVVPLDRPEGGAVISHLDVTERRRASVEAEKSRQELAHTLRVSTVGELTTSIAHELNQPLAAILANAQAARRLLSGTAAVPESAGELREILADIIEDDRRAGDVIRGLRDLLRKGQTTRQELELNELVRGVIKLLGSDLMIRGVTLRSSLADEALTTCGDPVQLQQVVLNLVVNALEAVAEADGERRIGIGTERAPAGMARISIEDTGPGLPSALRNEIFRPFFTTKPKGMGMGLSIARTIVEAHGGTISAEDRKERGACFTFTLPLAPARPAATAGP